MTVKTFYLVLAISRESFLLLSISERDRRGFVFSLFAPSRNSTGQVLEQLDLFVIALSRGLAQMIPRGLFQPKLFYDSLGFIFWLYSTRSLSRSDAWKWFSESWGCTQAQTSEPTGMAILGPHTEPTANNMRRVFSTNLSNF